MAVKEYEAYRLSTSIVKPWLLRFIWATESIEPDTFTRFIIEMFFFKSKTAAALRSHNKKISKLHSDSFNGYSLATINQNFCRCSTNLGNIYFWGSIRTDGITSTKGNFLYLRRKFRFGSSMVFHVSAFKALKFVLHKNDLERQCQKCDNYW